MNHLPLQLPEELPYSEFQTVKLKPKGILDYITQTPEPSVNSGLLGVQPKSQNHQPTTLWECLGVKES
jgi:hypothetical protein